MELLDKVLNSNEEYWNKENEKDATKGILVFECLYSIPQLCYGVSKVALCIAKSLQLKPAVILPWKNAEVPVAESMCNTRLQMRHRILQIFVTHLFTFLNAFVVSPKQLLKLKDDKALIGPYIYDAVLRKYSKKTNTSFSFKERLFVCFELCYYYYFKHVLRTMPVKAVVLGDNVYRYGLLFELCKVNGIVCYSPINLNSLFIRCFREQDDYERAFLTEELLDQLCGNVDYRASIDDYYKKRYDGSILQHDVLTAYANKETSSHEEFCRRYNIDENKKTVVLMPHVFADAPHVYLKPLYDDYWEWFVNTFRCLRQNQNVNVLVKEHPSSHLFGQKGIVTEYLKEKCLANLQIIETESTLSIIKNADIVVTGGGTIGLEMTFAGKNVVLACRPPYSELGFTKIFNARKEYEDFLSYHIQDLEPLSKEQHRRAIQASYVSFCCENNWNKDLELGGDIILLGKEYDNTILYENILKYNTIPLTSQYIYKLLDGFVHSSSKSLFKNDSYVTS